MSFYCYRILITDSMEKNIFEKLVVVQLAKKFSVFGIRRFWAVLRRAGHWTVSWASWIPSITSHSVCLKSTSVEPPQDVSCLHVFKPEFYMPLSCLPCCHLFRPFHLLSLINLKYFENNINCEAHHYAMFSIHPLFLLTEVQIYNKTVAKFCYYLCKAATSSTC
jgi:hypothetical protein